MLIDQLNKSMQNIIETNRVRLFNSASNYILNNPKMLYLRKMEYYKTLLSRLNKEMSIILTSKKTKLFALENHYILNNPSILYQKQEQSLKVVLEKLVVLNPMNTIKRGYAIVKEENHVISSIQNIEKNTKLNITLKDGILVTKVLETRRENGEK